MSNNYNSRAARRDAEKARDEAALIYVNQWLSLLHNSITIENLPNEVPKRAFLDVLFKHGKIVYDKQTELYLRGVYTGAIDIYGIPKRIQLYGVNGFTVTRDNSLDQIAILRANDKEFPVYTYLLQQARKMVDFDTAINQNLDAIRTQTIMQVADESELLTLVNAYESRRVGATVAYVNENGNFNDVFKVASTGAQYLVDKLLADRKNVLYETLETLGLVGQQQDKKERVQGFEQISGMSYCISNLFTMVDTLNYDAKVAGINLIFKANTPVVELMNIDKETGEQIQEVDNRVVL
jgi:hypothetical protein